MEDLIDQTLQVIELAKGITRADKERVILLGHSLGGAVAVLSAAQAKIIDKLVLWSAVGQPYEDIAGIIGAEKMETLKEAGAVDYQGYRLNKVFLESLKRYKPLDVSFAFKGNVLLVHGSKDDEITVQHCLSYFHTFQARNQGNCEKYIIDNADHVFSSGSFYNELIEQTKVWLAHERRFEKTLLQMNEQ